MSASDPSHYAPVLNKSLWFTGLPPETAQRLLDACVVRHVGTGQSLFFRGDRFDGIYCLVDGCIRLTGLAPDGQENAFSVTLPPTWFGEIAFFDGLPRTHDAQAVGRSVLLHVTPARLEGLFDEDPQWSFRLAVLMAQKTRMLFFAMEMLARLDTQAKLARGIVMVATQGWASVPDLGEGSLRLNQGALAETLGMTRQTVAAGLKALQEQGLVRLGYRRVTVLDWPNLCAVGKVDAAYPPTSVLPFGKAR